MVDLTKEHLYYQTMTNMQTHFQDVCREKGIVHDDLWHASEEACKRILKDWMDENMGYGNDACKG